MEKDAREKREEIRAWSQKLQGLLPQILPSAPNEAEFRRAIEPLLEQFRAEINLTLLVHAEYTLATGRADAIFNRLVIEYERPGVLKKNPDAATRYAIQQVKDYVSGLSKKERHKVERLAGVVFDGYYLIFARYINDRWTEEQPVKVNLHSLERFLPWLAGLASGIALTSENLNRDFSIEQLARKTSCVNCFRRSTLLSARRMALSLNSLSSGGSFSARRSTTRKPSVAASWSR